MVAEIRVARHGGTPWTQTIYQTDALTGANGRIPERVVSRQLSAALDDLAIDHVIRFEFEPFDSPTEDVSCDQETSSLSPFMDFLSGPAPVVALDSNLLLTNAAGGGCAVVNNPDIRGNAGVSAGGNIDQDPGVRIMEDTTRWGGNVSAALHEVGHNMGFPHDPHPGWGANVGGRWNRTPTTAANDVENLCGEFIEARAHNAVNNHLYYNDCVAAHMLVEEKEPLEQNGDTPGQFNVGCDGVEVVGADAIPTATGGEVAVMPRLDNGTNQERVAEYDIEVGPLVYGPFQTVAPPGQVVSATHTLAVEPKTLARGEHEVSVRRLDVHDHSAPCGTIVVEGLDDRQPDGIDDRTLVVGGAVALGGLYLLRGRE